MWNAVYPGETEFRNKTAELIAHKAGRASGAGRDWFSKAVIYSLYVDHFNRSFDGLVEKLPYLKDLGVDCLHLLPVLDSPMKDAGFDVRDYRRVRSSLAASEDPEGEFDRLLQEARGRDMKIIFDIPLNHCSSEHPWFQDARSSRQARYRDFFIWSDTPEQYKEARIIFKGLCESNWEYDQETGQYYFHRFFPIQPDLNYRNPEVLFEMIDVLLSWLLRGIDGFRADAIPYLWKEEGTSCENLSGTHKILRIFRYALEAVKPGTALLAEANQRPKDVVEYLRTEDECNAAYHFPLMPRIFKALAVGDGEPIRDVLSPRVTPEIPPSTSWVTFLRCHDELTLEMVSPEDRELIYRHYARSPEWDFRQGEGIAGRLFTLLAGDIDSIVLAWALMFTLPGTPLIYYGDEAGIQNNRAYWEEQRRVTGYEDSRYLNRGPLDWEHLTAETGTPGTPGWEIFQSLVVLTALRRTEPILAKGSLEFLNTEDPAFLSYHRSFAGSRILVRCNLSAEAKSIPEALRIPVNSRILFSRGISVNRGSEYLEGRGVVIALQGDKVV